MEKCNNIVQLMHPGVEHNSKSGIVWNTGQHRRKFIKHKGIYLKNKIPKEDELVFWAEWEPQSKKVKYLKNKSAGSPKLLFSPYYSFKEIERKSDLANTDPFIFGNFIFTVCQKYRSSHKKTILAEGLIPGDLVLFGSNLRGAFILDLVFVVKDSLKVTSSNYKKVLGRRIDKTYLDVALERIFRSNKSDSHVGYNNSDGCEPSLNEINIHFGATYYEKIYGMYSFVPCRVFEANSDGFSRPILHYKNIIQDGLKQNFKMSKKLEIQEIKSVWKKILEVMKSEKLYPGIKIDSIIKKP